MNAHRKRHKQKQNEPKKINTVSKITTIQEDSIVTTNDLSNHSLLKTSHRPPPQPPTIQPSSTTTPPPPINPITIQQQTEEEPNVFQRNYYVVKKKHWRINANAKKWNLMRMMLVMSIKRINDLMRRLVGIMISILRRFVKIWNVVLLFDRLW